MTNYNKKALDEYALALANYIINNDREENDYVNHCVENDIEPDAYMWNADDKVPHIYAIAKAYLERLEHEDQRDGAK